MLSVSAPGSPLGERKPHFFIEPHLLRLFFMNKTGRPGRRIGGELYNKREHPERYQRDPEGGLSGIQGVYRSVPGRLYPPLFLLQHAGTVREDVNRNTISEKVKFLLTIYEAADDYTDSSALALLETQQAVLDLFRSPALKVRDRWIRIRTEAGGREFNAAHLTLEAEYFDLRKSPEDTEDMMQEVEMKIKKEE